jgi:hypothetical protein
MPATTHALTDGQALSVSSFSKINIRFNADAEDVKLEGSVADSEFATIHDRVEFGKPYSDRAGKTSFAEGRVITVDVRGIEEIRFTGAATNINVSHAPSDTSGPVVYWAEVAPDDLVEFDLCRCLYVGEAGDLIIEDAYGNVVTFANCPVGILPVMCRRVMDGTVAGSILAGY